MNLDSLKEVERLTERRVNAIELRASIRSADLSATDIWFSGNHYPLFQAVSPDGFRAAIFELCTDSIIATEKELAALGVRVPKPEPICEATAEQWKREAGMFMQAWLRELGGRVIRKSHLIDALVLTTRQMAEKAAKYDALVRLGEPATADAKEQIRQAFKIWYAVRFPDEPLEFCDRTMMPVDLVIDFIADREPQAEAG